MEGCSKIGRWLNNKRLANGAPFWPGSAGDQLDAAAVQFEEGILGQLLQPGSGVVQICIGAEQPVGDHDGALGDALILQPAQRTALNALKTLALGGLQIPVRLFQIDLGVLASSSGTRRLSPPSPTPSAARPRQYALGPSRAADTPAPPSAVPDRGG